MASFTLDSIRAAAEAKYGSTDIDMPGGPVRLLNPLRLGGKAREKLKGLQDRLTDEAEDQEVLMEETIRLVAESHPAAERLLKEVGGDLAVLAEIFERYSEGAQVGEASPSQT
ncbi:phage tail assembly protein [Streptomyces albidoflavus]